MIKKLGNKKGSVLQVAIISMLLVGICTTVMSKMVVNQIKSTHRKTENVTKKYNTEEYVEETLGNFIERIDAEGEEIQIIETSIGIVDSYLKLSDYLVGDQGNLNRKIGEILQKIANQNADKDDENEDNNDENEDNLVTEEDKKEVMDLFTQAINKSSGSNANPHAGELLEIAKEYTQFILDNMLDSNGKVTYAKMNYKACNEYIEKIRKNLSEKEMETYKQVDKEYGNISVGYRDTNSNHKGNTNLSGLNNSFKINSEIHQLLVELNNITDNTLIKNWLETTEREIDNKPINNRAYLINKIEGTNYSNIIETENILIGGSGYLITENRYSNSISKLYKKTGGVSYEDIVKQRLNIIKIEIDMLIELLKYMKGLGSDSSEDITQGGNIIIMIPKNIELTDEITNNIIGETIKVEIDKDKSMGVNELEGNTDYYKYEILRSTSKIIVNLDIIGKSNKYNTGAEVDVTIHDIYSSTDYQVDYEIKDWEKINTP